jgi:D-alanyl-D-alanine carboxypeptidase
MAKLAVALQRHHSRYYHLFKRTKFTYKGRTYRGHNRVTTSFKGADGLKTGYTRASGFNLVTSAKRSDTRLIGVVMGGKSWRTRDKHMKKILTSSFKKVGTSRGYVNIGKIMKKIPIPRFKNSNYAVLTPESKTRTIPHKPIATAARYSNSVRNKFMQNFNVIPVSKPYHDYKKSQKLYDMVRSRYAGDNAGNSSWN